jgi:hypothetical protein
LPPLNLSNVDATVKGTGRSLLKQTSLEDGRVMGKKGCCR